MTDQRWREFLGSSGTASELVVFIVVVAAVLGWPWLLWSHSGHVYAWAVVGILWDATVGPLLGIGLYKFLK